MFGTCNHQQYLALFHTSIWHSEYSSRVTQLIVIVCYCSRWKPYAPLHQFAIWITVECVSIFQCFGILTAYDQCVSNSLQHKWKKCSVYENIWCRQIQHPKNEWLKHFSVFSVKISKVLPCLLQLNVFNGYSQEHWRVEQRKSYRLYPYQFYK